MKKLHGILLIILSMLLLITSLPVSAVEDEYNFDSIKWKYVYNTDISIDDVVIVCDYGSYGKGRVVILAVKGDTVTPEPYEYYIGDLCFRFSSEYYADRFYHYVKGDYGWHLYSVSDSYKYGYLSNEDIYNIALSHGVDTYSPEELTVEEDGIKWIFDPVNGKLTVRGNGKSQMPDYRLAGGRSTSPTAIWRYDIKTVKIMFVSSIGTYAFYNCENINSVDLLYSSSIGSIGNNAFEGCSSITDFVSYGYIEELSPYAFKNCASLRSVDLYVGAVGEHAFEGCASLEILDLGQSVRTLKDNAFEGCVSFKEFNFTEGIREIGDNLFKGCDSLEKMTFYGKPPKVKGNTLKDFNGEIFYPASSELWTDSVRSAYSKTATWTPFDAPDIILVQNYFDDLMPRAWYLSGIQYCFGRGFIEGMGNYRFDPNSPLTREQVAMILYKYLKADESYTTYSFADVTSGAWYADAVEWMYRKGYTKGISRTEFGVGLPVTRQDLVTLIYNAVFRDYEVKYWLGAYHIKGGIKSFSDVDDISDYAYDAMHFAVEVFDSEYCRGPGEIKPILYGDDGMLRPRDTCTRAEAAAIFQRSDLADYFSPVSTAQPPTS